MRSIRFHVSCFPVGGTFASPLAVERHMESDLRRGGLEMKRERVLFLKGENLGTGSFLGFRSFLLVLLFWSFSNMPVNLRT